MIVNVNGKDVFVSWFYENPELEELMIQKGLTKERYKQLSKTEVREWLGVKSLPTPLITHCILSNEDKSVICERSVKKHVNDPFKKDMARRYSLKKVLELTYPGPQNAETRKLFWEAYLNRKKTAVQVV